MKLREGLLFTHAGHYWKSLQLTRISGNSKENSIKPFRVVTGTWILYDKFDKYKVTLKGYGHSDSLLLLMLRFILKISKHYPILFSEANDLYRFYKMSWLLLKEISEGVFKSGLSKFCGRQAVFRRIYLVHS